MALIEQLEKIKNESKTDKERFDRASKFLWQEFAKKKAEEIYTESVMKGIRTNLLRGQDCIIKRTAVSIPLKAVENEGVLAFELRTSMPSKTADSVKEKSVLMQAVEVIDARLGEQYKNDDVIINASQGLANYLNLEIVFCNLFNVVKKQNGFNFTYQIKPKNIAIFFDELNSLAEKDGVKLEYELDVSGSKTPLLFSEPLTIEEDIRFNLSWLKVYYTYQK